MKAVISGASQNIQVKVVNYLNQSFLLSAFGLVAKNNLWLKAGKAGHEAHDLALWMFCTRMTCSFVPTQHMGHVGMGQYKKT